MYLYVFRHACLVHYPHDQSVCGGGETAEQIRANNQRRMDFLLNEGDVEIYWECQINEMLQMDKDMKKFFDETFDNGAIRIRDAFFGGRTNVECMYAVSDDTYEIKYVDVQVMLLIYV
jgi:hypothetical protein